tara:strand:+ start:2248 stop:3087 length:840 start_codon:yes stop_codon:yes gene_type:complete
MLLYLKNGTLFFGYSSVCVLMLTGHLPFVRSLYFFFFPMMMLYYLCFMYPLMHMKYKYVVMEKEFYRKYWIIFFHGILFMGDPLNACVAVATMFYVHLYKEIMFLIRYAEKRLGKIDESLFEKAPGYRIAHLHLNVFEDDIENRFHHSCYDSNRLYVLESTTLSKKKQLGISNYREIRRKSQTPREMNDDELLMYKASSNELLFIQQREYYVLYPLVVLIFLLAFILVSARSMGAYVHVFLVGLNVGSFSFKPLGHDIVVDLSYFAFAVMFAQIHYTKN